MKYLNCTWCGSSHSLLNNNCPSCGGSLTHKSDLLNLVLTKFRLNKPSYTTKAENVINVEVKGSSFLSTLVLGLFSIFLVSTVIKLAMIAFILIVITIIALFT